MLPITASVPSPIRPSIPIRVRPTDPPSPAATPPVPADAFTGSTGGRVAPTGPGARATLPPDLPAEVGLGVDTSHRYTHGGTTVTLTVFVPVPTSAQPGVQLDLARQQMHEVLPDRSVLSDGGVSRCFLGIDKRPGTPLAAWLDAMQAQIPRGPHGYDTDTVVDFLRTQVNRWVKWTPGSYANDGRAELPWDRQIDVSDSIWAAYRGQALADVDAPAVPTGATFPVVPFERYLERGEGYCIHKAVLASLLLERCGIFHKLVNGAVKTGPTSSVGHTWLELQDGRIFDPAHERVQEPERRDGDTFVFNGSTRFVNQQYLYLALA